MADDANGIAEDWPTVAIGDCLETVIDYRGKTPPKSPLGIPTLTAANVKNGRIDLSRVTYVSPETYRRWTTRGFPEPGDVLITTEAPVGEVAPFPGDRIYLITRRVIAMRGARSKLDNRFLLYALLSNIAQEQLSARIRGSTVNRVLKPDILGLRLQLPPLGEQQAIACILGALDDKIELNRRMNQTLESIARAIFKSWFVDFDPVRAKAAGQRPPGLAPQLAALFPDAFEDSELGEIPKGWRTGTIKDFAARIQYGLTTSAKQEIEGPQFLRITDIRGGAVDWRSVPYCDASDGDAAKYRVLDGDIVVARTGASTGENTYLIEPPVAVFASYLVRFQFADRGYGRIIGEFMRSEVFFSFVQSTLGGSAQPNANAQTLAGASMVFPTEIVASKYYELVRPFDLMRRKNDIESSTLAALRDALLPKLISGELRVPDAERIVGRCT